MSTNFSVNSISSFPKLYVLLEILLQMRICYMTLRSGCPAWYLNVLSVSPYKTLTFAMGSVHSYIASLPCQAWQVLNIAGWHSDIILGREIQNNTCCRCQCRGSWNNLCWRTSAPLPLYMYIKTLFPVPACLLACC